MRHSWRKQIDGFMQNIKSKYSFVLTLVLLLGLTTVTAATAASTTSVEPATQDAQILHLLNRISFGPSPADMNTVRSIGIDAYIEQQLHPAQLPKSSELESRLASLPTLNASMAALMAQYEPPGQKHKDLPLEQRKEEKKERNIVTEELTEAKILRAVMSPAQLQEVMTDFWFNHFNVFAEKGNDKMFIGSYERDAIRPYALGRFRDLLQATAHHPAMLFYLDNWLNTDPNSPAAGGKKIGINENYAREVMELHTLGVNGGYTQQDVTTLAHILTGWGLGEGNRRGPDERSSFYFDPQRHDSSTQTFLGYRISGGGQGEIEQVLDMLAQHPSTAKHISYQLAQYFVADEPPQSLVDKLTATFTSSGGDISAVLRALFKSPEFWDPQYSQVKFKPPFRYVVSSLRANGFVPQGDTTMLQKAVAQMGEPLYRCLTPNGYSNTNDQWQNSDALLKRIDFSKRLSGFLDDKAPDTIMTAMGKTWTPNTLNTAQNAEPRMKTALLLSSPEFMFY